MKYHDDYPYDDSDDFQDLDMDTDDYFDDIDFDYDEREAFVAPQRERRVPRTEVEEPYEDEIDRMRRRGRRSGMERFVHEYRLRVNGSLLYILLPVFPITAQRSCLHIVVQHDLQVMVHLFLNIFI